MDWISSLEKRFGSWAIPHLALYLIGIQVVGLFLTAGGYVGYADLVLVGGLVKVGQLWRLLSFMMLPKIGPSIWLILVFYIFYIMCRALEEQWGTFRFNLFILCGYLLTVLASLIFPSAIISNFYFLGLVTLAFATLFPNFEFLMFFIIPMKVKWIGWFTAGFYVLTLFKVIGTGPMVSAGEVLGAQVAIVAAFANYALFFGKEFITGFKADRRRKAFAAERAVAEARPRHVCTTCGVSDKSDPSAHFRYCSVCGECFCENHIDQHQHN
jgi:hypothetical protein